MATFSCVPLSCPYRSSSKANPLLKAKAKKNNSALGATKNKLNPEIYFNL